MFPHRQQHCGTNASRHAIGVADSQPRCRSNDHGPGPGPSPSVHLDTAAGLCHVTGVALLNRLDLKCQRLSEYVWHAFVEAHQCTVKKKLLNCRLNRDNIVMLHLADDDLDARLCRLPSDSSDSQYSAAYRSSAATQRNRVAPPPPARRTPSLRGRLINTLIPSYC